jgi:hypothetical protein
MAGYIDYAQMLSARQVQGSKSQLNGDAALLFFFESVRFDAGNGLYQAGLPVINVSRRAEYDLFH